MTIRQAQEAFDRVTSHTFRSTVTGTYELRARYDRTPTPAQYAEVRQLVDALLAHGWTAQQSTMGSALMLTPA